MKNPFYVYALKDPRERPAKIFYIGKGTGNRVFEHKNEEGDSEKHQVISQIKESGEDVIETILVQNLSESEALKIEAELISSFGIRSRGGSLVNKIRPNPNKISDKNLVNVPDGCYEKAQMGLALLKDAILELAAANAMGIRNADAAKHLGLQSSYKKAQKDYLTWSILGLLLQEGRMVRPDHSRMHVAVNQ